jgi:DNA repair exonuclease SbcCD ATPase subunit
MHISHLLLKDFGKFENFECDFSKGITLIKGPSEAGKSTLVDALTMTLFGNPAAEDPHKSEIIRWGGESAPILEAILNVEGVPVKLTKNYETGRSEVQGDSTGIPKEDPEEINSWLTANIGIPSEEIFKATACVNQGNITSIENSIEAIKDKLESMVTGGREDLAGSEATKKIDERIISKTMELANFSSFEEELDYNISKINRDIEILKTKRADLVQVETAYKNICEDLEAKSEQIEEQVKLAEATEKHENLVLDYKNVQSQYSKIKELIEKIEEVKEQKADLKFVRQEDVKGAEEAEASYKYRTRVDEELEKDLAEAKEESEDYNPGSFGLILMVMGFSGLAAAAIFKFVLVLDLVTPYIWHILAISVIPLLVGMSKINNNKQRKKQLDSRLDKVTKKYEENRADLEKNKSKLDEILKKHNATDSEQLRKNLWLYEETTRKFESLNTKHSKLLNGETIQSLTNKYESMHSEYMAAEKARGDFDDIIADKAQLERQKLVLNELEDRKTDLEHERTVIYQQIETVEGGSELMASYIERKEKLNSQIRIVRDEIEVLGLTKSCIEQSRQNVMVSKLEVLNKATSDILNMLTSGRYSKVNFDESDLKFRVWSNEKGGWINPETALSASTIEQIYLAARLALTELISDNKNSLLILDEPFSDYDENRLENAMKVLRNLSESHQILLLTSKNQYDKWADATVTL